MKALPYRRIAEGSMVPCDPHEATHVQLHMPGPIPNRVIPVMIGGTRAGTGNWTWNGDTEKPTLKPSILSRTRFTATDRDDTVCHTFVNDGMVQFLSDCTHELAGQTLPLLDVEQ